MPGSRSSTEAGGQKEWWKLVPWVAVISVVFMLTGLIVWGVNATNATNHSTKAIEALKGSLDTRISYVKPSLDALVVVYSIMAAILLSIALCRKRIEALTDKSGEARGAGSFCWLMVSSVLTFIWWVLCTMMVLLIMGNVVWASLVWVMNKGVGATLTSLEALQAAILANGTNVTLPVAPTNGTCPAGCLDLTFLDDLIGGYPCVCAQQRLRDAKKETSSALTCLTAMIIGSWFMYVGSSWLLMNSVSDFAITRRERKLLRKQIQVNVKYYPDEAFERSAETERARFMAEAEREKARYEVERARYLADAERMRAMYIDRADGAERGGGAYGMPPGPMAPPGANGLYDPRGGASASRSFANLNDVHAVEGQRFLPGGPSSTR